MCVCVCVCMCVYVCVYVCVCVYVHVCVCVCVRMSYYIPIIWNVMYNVHYKASYCYNMQSTRTSFSLRNSFAGTAIRIEDNVLITADGNDVLSKATPKEISELTTAMSS